MKSLANAARGEVALMIDGAPHILCLTLGALAELEAAFDAGSIAEISERFAHLSADDLLTVLAALTAGGGAALSRAELAAARVAPKDAAAAVSACFARALADQT